MRKANVRYNETELNARKRLALAIKIRRSQDKINGNTKLTLKQLKRFKRYIGLGLRDENYAKGKTN